MLHSLQQRYGEKLRATDGEIGQVKDFYLDDKTWAVRYLVADTGGWLRGRLVLISPQALGRLYPEGKVLLVNLTRRQIETSPSIDEHKPVSRQHEEEYHRHYGYPYYAQSWPLWGFTGYPVIVPPPPVPNAKQPGPDSHLRSARFIRGYKVTAIDGVVGELADFMIDGRRWVIREIVVQFGPWYAGKAIRVPTQTVTHISYDESTIHLNLTKDTMAEVNEDHVAPTLVSSNMGI
jgi:hypothetical protein